MIIKANNIALITHLTSPAPDSPDRNEFLFPFATSSLKESIKKYVILDTTVDDFDMATSIVASMEYCLRQENGLLGVGPTIGPLNAAIT
jgi:hypothetical protein